MFAKMLGKLPFVGRYLKYKEVQSFDFDIKELYLIRDSFKEAVSYEEIYDSLKRILSNPRTELQIELIRNKNAKVSFHSTTSQNALDLIDKEIFGAESLAVSHHLLSSTLVERPFIYWESSDQSILLFYSFMKSMVSKALLTYKTIDDKDLKNNQISEKEMLFINSILFRYLCFDFITLLVFYLEESNETTQQ